MIDTLIFDAGNVLLRVENEYIRKDISKTLKISSDPSPIVISSKDMGLHFREAGL